MLYMHILHYTCLMIEYEYCKVKVSFELLSIETGQKSVSVICLVRKNRAVALRNVDEIHSSTTISILG